VTDYEVGRAAGLEPPRSVGRAFQAPQAGGRSSGAGASPPGFPPTPTRRDAAPPEVRAAWAEPAPAPPPESEPTGPDDRGAVAPVSPVEPVEPIEPVEAPPASPPRRQGHRPPPTGLADWPPDYSLPPLERPTPAEAAPPPEEDVEAEALRSSEPPPDAEPLPGPGAAAWRPPDPQPERAPDARLATVAPVAPPEEPPPPPAATAEPDISPEAEAADGVASRPKPRARPLPRAIAIANQKGGVGKTTTAVNLGAALAELGYRVLVVDLDPQANATTGLGINPRNLSASVYDVLLNETPLEDCIEPTAVRNLFVVPATIDLAGAEIELVPAFSRELRLRRGIDRLGDDYDFIFIDCPPSLGLITINGLAAVSEVLVPIQCEYYALEGLGQLLRNIGLVQTNLNPRLELSTIVLTMYDARTKLSDQVVKEVRGHFGDKVCRNIVPRTVRLSEAPSFGQPISVFDPTSRGAIAYRELAKEVSGGASRRAG
jgi:chromosome partitioning protein